MQRRTSNLEQIDEFLERINNLQGATEFRDWLKDHGVSTTNSNDIVTALQQDNADEVREFIDRDIAARKLFKEWLDEQSSSVVVD